MDMYDFQMLRVSKLEKIVQFEQHYVRKDKLNQELKKLRYVS